MKYIFKLDTTENLHPGIHHSNMGLLTSYDIISIFSNPYPLAAQSYLVAHHHLKEKVMQMPFDVEKIVSTRIYLSQYQPSI